jgi:hypothetical protein
MKYDEWVSSIGSTEFEKRMGKVIWDACKNEVLKILKKPIQNCDLSWEEIDERFIDRIEKNI